jgi:GMP synthase (glutamine-hydrolysing)|tara:strand:- start:1687 stop:2175 length:489 start_codon:yes stop_codon:yes gene_type:complete
MILIINICKEKLHELEFVKPIEDVLSKNKIKFKTHHYSKILKKDLLVDKIIICGTSLKDNNFLENLKYFKWLKNFDKPVLGICGGSHIIGLILGNKLKNKKEIGLKEINVKKEFLGIKGKRKVYHLHKFYSLPEIFNHQNFYATLFHPEVRNKEMIRNFCNL